MKASFLFLVLLGALIAVSALGTPSDFFSDADEVALRTRLTEQLQRQGSQELVEEDYYAVATLASLSKSTSFPNSAQLCSKATALLASASAKVVDAQAVHRALGVISALKCDSQPSPAALSALGTKLVESVLAHANDAQLADLHAALAALQQIQKTASPAVTVSSDVATEVAAHIADLMEPEGLFRGALSDEEGNAGNAGLAYHALALLKRVAALDAAPAKQKAGADGKPAAPVVDAAKQAALKHIRSVAEPISALLASADEEDDNVLEFEDAENPLRATALFWIGAEALARSGESVTVTEVKPPLQFLELATSQRYTLSHRAHRTWLPQWGDDLERMLTLSSLI
jgi:hypothetical protein